MVGVLVGLYLVVDVLGLYGLGQTECLLVEMRDEKAGHTDPR